MLSFDRVVSHLLPIIYGTLPYLHPFPVLLYLHPDPVLLYLHPVPVLLSLHPVPVLFSGFSCCIYCTLHSSGPMHSSHLAGRLTTTIYHSRNLNQTPLHLCESRLRETDRDLSKLNGAQYSHAMPFATIFHDTARAKRECIFHVACHNIYPVARPAIRNAIRT